MQIDNPVYTYTVNRFLNAQNCLGYPGGSNTISYDNNGNMTVHPDKGISSIKYNYLNLPEQVTQDSKITNYIYRADGVKVKKSGTAGLATDYLDGFQYTETNLKFVPTSEGYFNFENSKYIYNYTDHADIYVDPGNTLSLGLALGAGGEGNLSFFSSSFTGKVSDMSLNSVVGTEAYVNESLVDVVGVTAGIAVSFDPNPNNGPVSGRWVTRSIGVAAGAVTRKGSY